MAIDKISAKVVDLTVQEPFWLQGNNETVINTEAQEYNRTLTKVKITLDSAAAAQYTFPLTADGNNVFSSVATIAAGQSAFMSESLNTTSLPAWSQLIATIPNMVNNRATISVDTISDYVEVAVPAAPLTELNTPTALTLTVVSATELAFTWDDPNTSPQETSVLIEYSTDSQLGSPVQVSLAAGTTSVNFTGLTADVRIYAGVTHIGDDIVTSNSLRSNILNEVPTAVPTVTGAIFTGTQDVSWPTDASLNIQSYEVQTLWKIQDSQTDSAPQLHMFGSRNSVSGHRLFVNQDLQTLRYRHEAAVQVDHEMIMDMTGGDFVLDVNIKKYNGRMEITVNDTLLVDVADTSTIDYSTPTENGLSKEWSDGHVIGTCFQLEYYELSAAGSRINDLIELDFLNGNTTTIPNIAVDKPTNHEGTWGPSGGGTYENF